MCSMLSNFLPEIRPGEGAETACESQVMCDFLCSAFQVAHADLRPRPDCQHDRRPSFKGPRLGHMRLPLRRCRWGDSSPSAHAGHLFTSLRARAMGSPRSAGWSSHDPFSFAFDFEAVFFRCGLVALKEVSV